LTNAAAAHASGDDAVPVAMVFMNRRE